MNSVKLHFRRLRTCSVGLVLMLIPFGLAQRGYAQEPDPPDPTVSSKPDVHEYGVAGTVVNSVTGEPIRRAAVAISGQTEHATLTDNSGHFEFGGLAEGRVSLTVNKPGFFNDQAMPYQRITVQVGRDASPVVLRMVPAGAIVGRVTARDEEPLEGFMVRVIAKQNAGGRQMWLDRRSQAMTDENGDFRIANLPPATYYVAVDQSRETSLSQPEIPNAREQGYAQVFYLGASEFSAAVPVELQAGQEVETNFVLAAEPIYQVSGVVSGQENPASALVFARQAGESSDFTQQVSTQDGQFQTKLPAGSYSVRGFTATGMLLSTAGSSVVINSDRPDVHIVLAPAESIQVVLRKESGGGTIEQVDASQGNGIPGMSLQLVPNTPSLTRSGNWWNAQSGAISNVEPGVYEVEINTVGPWWAKSVQCGNVDLLSDDLTVTAGAQMPPIEVTLRDDAATVSGTVGPAEQEEQATVLLVQPRGARNVLKAAVTGPDGRFQFQGVAPGDYVMLAFDGVDQLEYQNPEVLSPYLSSAVRISLQPHGTASVNLNRSPISR